MAHSESTSFMSHKYSTADTIVNIA